MSIGYLGDSMMSIRPVSILLGALALFAASGAQAAPTSARTATLPFEECLSIIGEIAEDLGEEPVTLIKTGDVHTVRIDAADGFVTVSCSRPDSKMTLTKAGPTVTADLAKPRP
jgi:hypothetical protein